MSAGFFPMKQEVIDAFETEFRFIRQKFEVMDLLSNGSLMDYDIINELKLPSSDYNIIWHPGVYVFIGDNIVYRVGVSMINSRKRVMDHLADWTGNDDYNIWDINKCNDKSILLFNVIDKRDRHWLMALEVFLEIKFEPKIGAKRIG